MSLQDKMTLYMLSIVFWYLKSVPKYEAWYFPVHLQKIEMYVIEASFTLDSSNEFTHTFQWQWGNRVPVWQTWEEFIGAPTKIEIIC